VPPAYYADLACERGRCYLNELMSTDDRSSAGTRASRGEERQHVYDKAVREWGQGVHADVRETMFYI
jgi:eukaryotic translation initiation factor 2C